MREHRILATLVCLGLTAFALPVRAEDAAPTREADLAQRRAALESDQKQQAESLAATRASLLTVTKQLAPFARVCAAQGEATLTRADAERAERSAEAVKTQLRDASTAAKACTAPNALKAAHQALSDAIDQTAVIEKLVTAVAGGSDDVAGARSKIPEGLTALETFTQSWTGVEERFKSLSDRVAAYDKDVEAFNGQAEPVKPPLTAPHAESLKIDAALQENFDGLAASVRKINDVRNQLAECQRSEGRRTSAALINRVDAARKNAALAFATYGRSITRDSADCQTRLETNAAPGDAPVLEAAMGRPSPESTEPPPPKAAPVAVVTEQAPPAPIPGSKIKPPAEKRSAKRTAPTIVVAAVHTGGVKVTGVSGFASTQEGSNTFGLGEGQTVAAGAAVETKLSSRVRLGGMAQTVDIGADTRVEVPRPPYNFLKLANGTVDIKRNRGAVPLADEPNFDGIETDQGVITDTGAHYRVIVAQGQTAVEVLDGTVHLAGSYVLKLAASDQSTPDQPTTDQPDAEKRSPVPELDLATGERAIMLHVGGTPITPTVVASAPAAEAPAAAPPAAAPAPRAVTAQTVQVYETPAAKRREARRAAAAAASAKVAPRVAEESSSSSRLPGFLTARVAEAVTSPSVSATIPAFASVSPASTSEAAVSSTWPASGGADPVEQARVQLQAQRQQDEEKQRLAEQQRAEQQRVEQARIEEQRRTAEAERFASDQFATGPMSSGPGSSRIPAAFAGTWQCRVFPSQRGRFAAAPIQSQIIIRPTTRGFEAFAGGERLPSVAIQGTRIRFAQVVAGNDSGYYGAIDFDLQNGGSTLTGTGRVRVSMGPYMQEVPASLSCERSRY